jgi:beta-ureidopropionase
MRRCMARLWLPILVIGALRPTAIAAPQQREQLPGRQVKVAALAIGYGGQHEAKLSLALQHLEVAGRSGADIACLPEAFAGFEPEAIPGVTTLAIAAVAKKHAMYVICPICEKDGERVYNTAVLIDRKGAFAGRYRKIYAYFGEKTTPSREGVKAFDTDFGKIGILVCFDVNFPELWQQLGDLNVDMVFWPSSLDHCGLLNAYAILHGYWIVCVGGGNVVDFTGDGLPKNEEPFPGQRITTVDTDRTMVIALGDDVRLHRLLSEHVGEVQIESHDDTEGWYLLRAMKPGIRVRTLCAQYRLETARQFMQRARKEIDDARQAGKKVPDNPYAGLLQGKGNGTLVGTFTQHEFESPIQPIDLKGRAQ